MSNTKLPPELVEEMKPFVDTHHDGVQINAEQCAQIAVNYAERENMELREALNTAVNHMRMHGLTTTQYEQLLKSR